MAVVAGIDEAGRGAVIGPLVIAGVSIEEDREEDLRKIGVRDSKQLSPRRREQLAKKIEELAKDIVIVKVSACKVDGYRKDQINLNRLEAIKMADIISHLKPDKAYIDSPDVNTERLKLLLKKLMRSDAELVVEHKADTKFPPVSAASIIAKVTRDEEIEQLKKQYGDIGPGYSSNEITIQWLREWIRTHDDFPDIVRKSWVTSQDIKKEKLQNRVSDWLKRAAWKDECGKEPKEIKE